MVVGMLRGRDHDAKTHCVAFLDGLALGLADNFRRTARMPNQTAASAQAGNQSGNAQIEDRFFRIIAHSSCSFFRCCCLMASNTPKNDRAVEWSGGSVRLMIRRFSRGVKGKRVLISGRSM